MLRNVTKPRYLKWLNMINIFFQWYHKLLLLMYLTWMALFFLHKLSRTCCTFNIPIILMCEIVHDNNIHQKQQNVVPFMDKNLIKKKNKWYALNVITHILFTYYLCVVKFEKCLLHCATILLYGMLSQFPGNKKFKSFKYSYYSQRACSRRSIIQKIKIYTTLKDVSLIVELTNFNSDISVTRSNSVSFCLTQSLIFKNICLLCIFMDDTIHFNKQAGTIFEIKV